MNINKHEYEGKFFLKCLNINENMEENWLWQDYETETPERVFMQE